MVRRVMICMLLAVALLVCFPACQSSHSPVDELLSLGEQYLLELDYEQALAQFLKVIELEPMNPRGYTGAAEAYLGLGDVDGAIDILEQGWDLTEDTEIDAMLDRIWDMREGDTQLWESGDAPTVRYESPEEAYRAIVEEKRYLEDFHGGEPEAYAILDIDGNGVAELIVVDDYRNIHEGYLAFGVYCFDTEEGIARYIGEYGSNFVVDIHYSPRYRSIVLERPGDDNDDHTFFTIVESDAEDKFYQYEHGLGLRVNKMFNPYRYHTSGIGEEGGYITVDEFYAYLADLEHIEFISFHNQDE